MCDLSPVAVEGTPVEFLLPFTSSYTAFYPFHHLTGGPGHRRTQRTAAAWKGERGTLTFSQLRQVPPFRFPVSTLGVQALVGWSRLASRSGF